MWFRIEVALQGKPRTEERKDLLLITDYSDAEIDEIAERSRKLAADEREVHIVFNNNNLDYAPRAATRLRAALGQVVATPPQTPELF